MLDDRLSEVAATRARHFAPPSLARRVNMLDHSGCLINTPPLQLHPLVFSEKCPKITPVIHSRPLNPVMLMSPMIAVLQVTRLKALTRCRRPISDACLRTDVAHFFPNGTLAGAQVAS